MSPVQPTAPPAIAKDAHYHAIAATAKWSEFVAAELAAALDTPTARARRDERRIDATTYARGTLGGH